MSDEKVVAAEPSSAQPSTSDTLAAMTPEQRSEWRMTGKLPDQPKTQETAPADAPKVETPAEGEETPLEAAPEPGTDGKATQEHKAGKQPGQKLSAEERINQLIAEKKSLAAELEEARKPKAAEPAKVEAKAEPAQFKPTRPRPTSADIDEKSGEPKYKSLDDLLEARDVWNREQWDAERAFNDRQSKEAEQRDTAVRQFGERVQKAEAKHADFKKIAFESDITCPSNVNDAKKIREGSILDAFIVDSEIGPEVLYFLGSNPAEIEKINGLSPFQQARYLTALEAELSDDDAPPAKPASAPAPKVTRASRPASEVGGQATSPDDPLESAVKSRDFPAYKHAANAKDLARAK